MGVKVPKKIVALLQEHERLTNEAEALMEKHGITQKLADASEAKKKACEFMLKVGAESVPMPDGTRYDVRRDAYNKQVVGDDDQLAEVKNPTAVIPLKTILKQKYAKDKKTKWQDVWKLVTTRRVDVAKLEALVKKGDLTVDEISPAYYQDTKTPYLRKV